MTNEKGPTMIPKWASGTVIFIVLGIIVLFNITPTGEPTAASRRAEDATASEPAALKCDSPAAKTAASKKLAEWLDQNIVSGNAVHVSAKLLVNVAFAANLPSAEGHAFVSADGTSSTLDGDPQGTQRCTANFVIAFKEADGTLFGGYAPNGFTTQFLLASGPQITLNDADMRASTINEASAITRMEAEREHENAAPTVSRPDPVHTYAMIICKTDQPCKRFGEPITMKAASTDCIGDMFFELDKSKYEVLDDRIYAKGERSAWYECTIIN